MQISHHATIFSPAPGFPTACKHGSMSPCLHVASITCSLCIHHCIKPLAHLYSHPGEWEGITASFDGEGEPQQLPENYVPGAYREWGVELFDWQSICSSIATPQGLSYNVKRMMPTVGCEADAVAFTEEAHNILQAESV